MRRLHATLGALRVRVIAVLGAGRLLHRKVHKVMTARLLLALLLEIAAIAISDISHIIIATAIALHPNPFTGESMLLAIHDLAAGTHIVVMGFIISPVDCLVDMRLGVGGRCGSRCVRLTTAQPCCEKN
jgi:hypothetical protein